MRVGIVQRLLDGLTEKLEKRFEKKYGHDELKRISLLGEGVASRRNGIPGHVWADYFFLSLCYASASGMDESAAKLAEMIKKDFPNYDPSKRFGWKNVMPENLEGAVEDSYGAEVFKHKIPVVGEMNQFCEAHRDFSFAKLAPYFEGAKNMRIKGAPEKPDA